MIHNIIHDIFIAVLISNNNSNNKNNNNYYAMATCYLCGREVSRGSFKVKRKRFHGKVAKHPFLT